MTPEEFFRERWNLSHQCGAATWKMHTGSTMTAQEMLEKVCPFARCQHAETCGVKRREEDGLP